jgi:D-alanyl-D-alanine carboxypeptidase (penicillin-binding protein 5/6)
LKYRKLRSACTWDGKNETFLLFFFLLGICSLFPLKVVSAEGLQSRSAVVMDAETGNVLYAKNPDLRLMPASTTKLMTALVVIERKELGDIVTISRNASKAAPTKIGLRQGEWITVEALLYSALMKSANDAAVALAEAVAGSEEQFIYLMNKKAAALGLNDTRFVNSNGLPGTGQYITAYDLAKLLREAIRHPLLREIIGTRVAEITTGDGKTVLVKNTNRLLWTDGEFLGGKTGYTREARHCFVSAGEREGRTMIVALLGTPVRDFLWQETAVLMDFGSRVLNNLEEPVVYLTKIDYDAAKIKKASYTKKHRPKKRVKKRHY